MLGRITRLIWLSGWATIFAVRDIPNGGSRLKYLHNHPAHSHRLKGDMHENGHRNHG